MDANTLESLDCYRARLVNELRWPGLCDTTTRQICASRKYRLCCQSCGLPRAREDRPRVQRMGCRRKRKSLLAYARAISLIRLRSSLPSGPFQTLSKASAKSASCCWRVLVGDIGNLFCWWPDLGRLAFHGSNQIIALQNGTGRRLVDEIKHPLLFFSRPPSLPISGEVP